MRPVRTREDTCASDLIFDRWLAEDLDPELESSTTAHVASCARCAARWARLKEGHRAFADRPMPELVAKKPSRQRRWLYPSAATTVLAAAAALVLFVRSPPRPELAGDGERTKGGPSLGLYVKRGERVFAGSAAEPLQPGDAVRFEVTLGKDRFVAVLSLDGALHGSTYFPADGGVAAKIAAGTSVMLPGSIILDDTLGEETLHALSCETPVALEPIRTTLERTHALPDLPGCTSATLRIRKVPASP